LYWRKFHLVGMHMRDKCLIQYSSEIMVHPGLQCIRGTIFGLISKRTEAEKTKLFRQEGGD
jgi:hypothetical protein